MVCKNTTNSNFICMYMRMRIHVYVHITTARNAKKAHTKGQRIGLHFPFGL